MYHINYTLHGKEQSFASTTQPHIVDTTNNSITFAITPLNGDILLLKLWFSTIMTEGPASSKEIVNHEWWKLSSVNISYSYDTGEKETEEESDEKPVIYRSDWR